MLYPLAFIVLIGVLITVHELGHFIVAKLTGVRVLVFSIGFGPRLIGFRRGDTDYRLSVFPLGGYVRMYGDDINEDVPPEERHRAFLHKPFVPKSAIAIAGPLANLLLPVALFFAMYVGEETVADAVVGTVLPGEPAEAAGLRPGDRITHINNEPVSVFSDVSERVTVKGGVPLTLTVIRAGETLQVPVTPRIARAPTPLDADRTVGRLGLLATQELPVVLVAADSPAAKAGVRTKDRITQVNGVDTPTRDALLTALDARVDEPWTLTIERSDVGATAPAKLSLPLGVEGHIEPAVARDRFAIASEELAAPATAKALDEVQALVEEAAHRRALRRGLSPVDGLVSYVAPGTAAEAKQLDVGKERIVAVDGRALRTSGDLEILQAAPDAIHIIGLLGDERVGKPAARVVAFRMGPPPERQLKSLRVLGAGVAAAYGDPATVVRDVSVIEALRRGVAETGALCVEVLRGFALLFSGRVGLESLGGPLTIYNLAGQAASVDGSTYVRLMALISVNLAILNMLPIPILDGGHLLLFTIEAVQRRRLTVETRMRATKIGLVFVGLLMLIAIGNDILGKLS